MRPVSKSLSTLRALGANSALAGILAQAALLPLMPSQAHARDRSIFEVGSTTRTQVDLTAAEAKGLLQSLDQAVADELMQNPELLQSVEEAVAEHWPAIAATLPESPPGSEGVPPAAPELTPSPSPSAAPEVTPSPSPSAAPEVTPSPSPSAAPEVTPSPSPSAAPEVTPSPSPSAAPEASQPATPSPAKKPGRSGPRESWERIFGYDFEMGVPGGVGLSINVTPVRPITVAVGVTTPLGITVTAHADVTLNIIPIFFNSRWTPTVTVGYRYVHYTGLTDTAINLISGGQLAESDIAFQIKGTGLHMVSALAGLEYVSRKGFHFGLRGGYIWQVGDSVGQTDESGIVFSGFRSWNVLLMFGRRY